MTKDFNVIKESLNKIFKKKEYFRYFTSREGMTGWEKWLQIELALQLSKIGESKIEDPFFYHMGKRRPASKSNFKKCFVDVTFRVKFARKNSIGAIELKVANSQRGLRAALSDLHKISAIREKSWKFRSVTAILIYPTGSRLTKFTNIKNELVENNFLVRDSFSVENFEIPDSNFELIMVGWEKSLTKDMTIDSYGRWVENVRDIFKKYDVKPSFTSPRRV